jgi:uncharacterized protein (TIGR02246 family)
MFCLPAAGIDQAPPKADTKLRSGARPKQDAKTGAGAPSQQSAEAAVKASAERFIASYNKHDSKAAASEFTTTAVFTTENGTTIRGRGAIERHFTTVFAEFPGARLDMQVETIDLVTSDVAVEQGRVEFTATPGAPPESSRYVALHVFQDGRWQLARARDFSADAAPRSNHDRLLELEWLVGEWIEEGEDSLIATSCQWSADRNYLLQEFTIRLGSEPPVTGSTRIGWDPLTRQIKSWTFDSDGGYSEALWTRDAEQWVLKSRGVTHRGRSYSRTAILRHVDQTTLSWESRDRVEGGSVVSDRGPLVVKRRPPPPGE